jgi:anti-sigma regulatory factor (Ser/Thr protein kinase)
VKPQDDVWHQMFEVALPDTVADISDVRHAARELLANHPTVELAEVVISELTGNAVRHGRPPSALRVYERDSCLLIEVHDSSDVLPEFGPPLQANLGTDGRGLRLVLALSSDFSVEAAEPHGKSVWATVCDV